MEYYDLDHFAELTAEICKKVNNPTIKLVVYNAFYEEIRIVVLKPHLKWGYRDSLLGAEFGSGVMNNFRDIIEAYRQNKKENTDQSASEALEEKENQAEDQKDLNTKKDEDQIHNTETVAPATEEP